MMVNFVSQCEKSAINRTRRVLDSFASRIGDNVWQTVITNEGLNAVKKLLRKTASKNTAVACHWIRTRTSTEVVWIVGNRHKFNTEGVVPVHTTQQNILSPHWENDWHFLPLIKALTAMAALFHDWGKASQLFQEKLKSKTAKGDPIRHEWLSYLFLHALIPDCNSNAQDSDWLIKLTHGQFDESQLIREVERNTVRRLHKLPPVAGMIAWLIVTHHKLPVLPKAEAFPKYNRSTNRKTAKSWCDDPASSLADLLSNITQEWGYENFRIDEKERFESNLRKCLVFPYGLPCQLKPWLLQVKKWAARTIECLPKLEASLSNGSWRVILQHARLALMLGDYSYSAQVADPKWHSNLMLYANTDKKTASLKQSLDEHLLGVSRNALNTAHLLPVFENNLPQVKDVAALKRKSPIAFKWQDTAVDKISKWKLQLPDSVKNQRQGFFAVNMASTGCGKTFANAKIMRALSSDGDSLRYVLALGLRTLTLQTGDEYRDRIGLDNSELAVLIGSRAVMELHNQNASSSQEVEDEHNQQAGSESLESLLDEDIDFECNIPEEGVTTVITNERDRKLLYAPVLACTIDHLMGATESKRGGKYILPMLRLMSSDLVIDEVDDFVGSDLIAIGRLIHLAGLLGRKVMISSATIPPDMAEGYFNAYREGWLLYCKTRNASDSIACAWIDEFATQIVNIQNSSSKAATHSYCKTHGQFVEKRIEQLRRQPVRRKGSIIDCSDLYNGDERSCNSSESKEQLYYAKIQQAIIAQHLQHHDIDPISSKHVSFGVVRVANTKPCVTLTKYLLQADWPEGISVKVMAYHSRQVLLLRSEQEKHLDSVLKRNARPEQTPQAFQNTVIRKHLDNSNASHVIFVLVATPAEEVGRDHDFDWAVVEPSSFRSIIQIAGRVRRHREAVVEKPNIALLQYNLKAIKGGISKVAYCHPGYENSYFKLKTHDLATLLKDTAVTDCINAIPRIQKAKQLDTAGRLADLEHYSIKTLLCEYEKCGPESLQGWLSHCWWLTALPQVLTPFRASQPEIKLYLAWHKDELRFVEKTSEGSVVDRQNIYGITQQSISTDLHHRLWLKRDYRALLEAIEEKGGLSMKKASLRYGEINIPDYGDETKRYKYDDQFGMIDG